jgi:hypothetical protein
MKESSNENEVSCPLERGINNLCRRVDCRKANRFLGPGLSSPKLGLSNCAIEIEAINATMSEEFEGPASFPAQDERCSQPYMTQTMSPTRAFSGTIVM